MITMAPALRAASRLSQGLRHEELRDVVEGVEEDRTVEGVIREPYRLGSGLVKRPRGNGLPRDRQRLAVRVDPNDTRSPLRQRPRENAGAAADVEDLLP